MPRTNKNPYPSIILIIGVNGCPRLTVRPNNQPSNRNKRAKMGGAKISKFICDTQRNSHSPLLRYRMQVWRFQLRKADGWPTLPSPSRSPSSHFNNTPVGSRGVTILPCGFGFDLGVPRPSVWEGRGFCFPSRCLKDCAAATGSSTCISSPAVVIAACPCSPPRVQGTPWSRFSVKFATATGSNSPVTSPCPSIFTCSSASRPAPAVRARNFPPRRFSFTVYNPAQS